MHRLAIRSGLSVALVLAGLVAAGAAVAPPPGVTSLTFVDPAAPVGQLNQGELRATFSAAPAGDGNWTVDATFRPHQLNHMFWVFDLLPAQLWVTVHKSASATVVAPTGKPVSMTAFGLSGTGGIPMWVSCTLTIGSDGVVTVQSVSVGGSLGGGGSQN